MPKIGSGRRTAIAAPPTTPPRPAFGFALNQRHHSSRLHAHFPRPRGDQQFARTSTTTTVSTSLFPFLHLPQRWSHHSSTCRNTTGSSSPNPRSRPSAPTSSPPASSSSLRLSAKVMPASRFSHQRSLEADSLPALCAAVHARVQRFLEIQTEDGRVRAVQAQSRVSLGIIAEALRRYRLDELSLSYNGGKDCLVLLILYLAALHPYSQNNTATTSPPTDSNSPFPSLPPALPTVYIISPHPFAEVDAFVASSEKTYHLSLARYAQPMKEAFASYLSDYPSVHAIFVGTRRTDPHGALLQPFLPTDRGWPSFMRIHPVLDWHYAEIWTFIRLLEIPYCVLYDRGYTSLGGTTDTEPNPVLKQGEGEGGTVDGEIGKEGEKFRPAYELVVDAEERLGRS